MYQHLGPVSRAGDAGTKAVSNFRFSRLESTVAASANGEWFAFVI
jgi:hypothetical protein